MKRRDEKLYLREYEVEQGRSSTLSISPVFFLPELGSSKMTIWGEPIMAMATLSLRLLPPEYEVALRPANSTKSICCTFCVTTVFTCASSKPFTRAYNSRCSRPVSRSNSASNCGQYPTNRRTTSGFSAMS